MKPTRADAKRKRPTRSSSVSRASPSFQVEDSSLVSPSPTDLDVKSEKVSKLKKTESTPAMREENKELTSPYFDKRGKHGRSLELASGSDDYDHPLPTAKRRRAKVSQKDVTEATATETESSFSNIGPINNTSEPSKPKNTAPGNTSSIALNQITIGGEPDGNGGLNQPSPFNVEYSKSSRATCRTCDEIIKKGEVRVGHTPLFRGKVCFWYPVLTYQHL